MAAALIEDKSSADIGLHILLKKAFITGNYEEALRLYEEINPDYPRYNELHQTVLNALLHLGRYSEAEQFASSKGLEEHICDRMKRLKESPLKVRLDSITVIPFAGGNLSEYFPDLEVDICGQKVVAHVDTRGTFLVMGPKRAKELGIELVSGKEGYHGHQKVETSYGIARSFGIRDAILKSVPVVALASLNKQDFIIFGINILQQFLSTLDYPNKRLILSPRSNEELREAHLAMLPDNRVDMPFYMGGDHYMLAHGGIGAHKGLVFFVDSGLVLLYPDGQGGIRQVAFRTSRDLLLQWDFAPGVVEKDICESPFSISPGSLAQDGHLISVGEKSWGPFEDVRIDGLLGHAFLKRYAWTLDFSNFRYIFSRDLGMRHQETPDGDP
jgi:hypothetical protein